MTRNDGLKDIFSAGSHVVDNVALFNPTATYEEGNFLYRNVIEITWPSGVVQRAEKPAINQVLRIVEDAAT